MPGREKEFEAYKAQEREYVAQGGSLTASPQPSIDEERRSRSPGMSRNFYDISTADFKRPHGMRSPLPEAPAAAAGMASSTPAAAAAATSAFGAETPLPGRERDGPAAGGGHAALL